MRICLDAGHYGKYNQSPANKAYYESEAMWKLHLLQKKYLEQYGCEVILTRPNIETDKDVYLRGATARGCDLFISNHSNATGSGVNNSIDYPVVYVSINNKGNSIGEKLAACITAVMGTKQKGYFETRKGNGSADYYGVIRGAVAVGVVPVLIEHSFHTNTAATNWLLNDANLDKLAKAEVETIAKHFGLLSAPAPVPDNKVTAEKRDIVIKTTDSTLTEKGLFVDGTNYVHVRTLEKFGFIVGWDATDKSITLITPEEKEILYRITQAEAGGEDAKGRTLVSNVIMNRVKSAGFPNSIKEVVFEPGQFEPTRNEAYEKAVVSDSTKAAVNDALAGIDYSQGALYFIANKAITLDSFHERKCVKLFVHGGHTFYK